MSHFLTILPSMQFKAMHLLAQNYIDMLPDLTKTGLDVHSGQIYFSPLVHAAIVDIVT